MIKNYRSEVGIIGLGFVGGCVRRYFKGADTYSLTKGDFKKVNRQKYIFLCLPTPFNKKMGGFDLTALHQNISQLSGKKNIIIKSTILPGTTNYFQQMYPQHNFFFNPEFLRAKHAWKDFINPSRQIVGYVKPHLKSIANKIIEMLPLGEFNQICSAKEAEAVKLISNCYLASRVVFANQMYDWITERNLDYKKVIRMVKFDPRIGASHWDIFTDKHRGYAGLCFPKDMQAVIMDSGSPLLELTDKLNDEYLKK